MEGEKEARETLEGGERPFSSLVSEDTERLKQSKSTRKENLQEILGGPTSGNQETDELKT